jgi:hypothetical protein
MSTLVPTRYRSYCVHKYITNRIFALEGFIAKLDFSSLAQIKSMQQQFAEFDSMMKMHAEFEELLIHPLLKEKGSHKHEPIEADHEEHHIQLKQLHQQLEKILTTDNEEERVYLGHTFYLAYRSLVSDILKHLNDEETHMVTELHRLYTDEELKDIEHRGYQKMPVERIIHMIKTQFPYMDPHDKAFILSGIKEAVPEKFALISESV